MRRSEREIKDRDEILEVMKKCDSCSVAFFDGNYPYVIPMNFGIANRDNKVSLYFHGAAAGKKLELIRKNNKVAFEMNTSHRLITGNVACDTTMDYESVCGTGQMFVADKEEKGEALVYLMNQYLPDQEHHFAQKSMEAILLLRLDIVSMTGKRAKKKQI